MKLRILFFLLMLHVVAARATNLSGGIYNNTTWTLSGSPYVMTGDVVVFEGVNLTIEPGVVISVDSGAKLEVRGRIIAKGTAAQNITFKGNSASAGRYYWTGIVFIGTSNPLGSGSQATFTYCNISNAQHCFNFDIAYHGPYIFKNCNFTNNYYVNNDGGMGGMLFDSCTIQHNYQGFDYFQFGGCISNCTFNDNVYGVNGSDSLINCTFTNHSNIAVQPYGYTKGCKITNNNVGVRCLYNSVNNTFIGNTVKDNTEGVDMLSWFDGSINFTGNQICNNTAYNIRLNSANNCNLSYNCWCGADSSTIRSKIIDGYTDISRGIVTIGFVSGGCTTGIAGQHLDAEPAIYPDPLSAGEWLHIQYDKPVAMNGVTLVDVLGKKHSFKAYMADNNGYSLKLPECAPGIYFVIIPTTDGSESIAKQIRVQ